METESFTTERDRREAFLDAALSQTSLIAAQTEWGVFLLRTDDAVLGRILFVRGQRKEMRILQHALDALGEFGLRDRAASGRFLDVGANIGTTTICALNGHGFAGADTFEPELGNERLLVANLALNGLTDRARVFPIALSNLPGEVKLVLDPVNSGGNRVLTHGDNREWLTSESRGVRVTCQTLDGLIQDGDVDPEVVGMLWIDAQGHEGQILAGAEILRERAIPTVFEYDPLMLEQAGWLDRVTPMLKPHYSHFVDLAAISRSAGRQGFAPRPITELDALSEVYAEGRFADVLVVSL